MRSITNVLLYSHLLIMASSCATQHIPHIQQCSTRHLITPVSDQCSTWVLDSLCPDENTVLFKRQITCVSIHMETYMKASCEGYFILQFWANKKQLSPYVLKRIGNAGEINSSVNIRKYFKVKGKVENVTIALYLIEKNISGNTIAKTLLKQYRRKYHVSRGKKLKFK